MLILFSVGVGAIRGFAVTISLGILISMFTALVLVRLLISRWLRSARPKTLRIGTRLRQHIDDAGLGQVQVQQFGDPREVLFRFEAPDGSSADQQAMVVQARQAVEQAVHGGEIRRVDVVGPTVGQELLEDGLMALGLAAIAMFIYIAWRFEWPFAVGAVATMFLDLTKTVGFLALTGFDFNLGSIAAILTIMGFSINDKVVVYDRVRENLHMH
jgi:SecD/SecF fusion protein